MRAQAILLRIAAILAGYVAACVAATVALRVAGLMRAPVARDVGWQSGLDAFGLIAIYAFLPASIMIALAERNAWRGWPVHAALGAAIPLPVTFMIAVNTRMPDFMTAFGTALPVAGAIGGLAYWLMAGRNAGRGWRAKPCPHPAP